MEHLVGAHERQPIQLGERPVGKPQRAAAVLDGLGIAAFPEQRHRFEKPGVSDRLDEAGTGTHHQRRASDRGDERLRRGVEPIVDFDHRGAAPMPAQPLLGGAGELDPISLHVQVDRGLCGRYLRGGTEGVLDFERRCAIALHMKVKRRRHGRRGVCRVCGKCLLRGTARGVVGERGERHRWIPGFEQRKPGARATGISVDDSVRRGGLPRDGCRYRPCRPRSPMRAG